MTAPTPKPQIEKFRDLARELETDDDEARFDERLKKMAKARTPRAAFWRIDQVPGGHRPDYFEGGSITPSNRGPVFSTPQEGDAWLQARGCRQDPADPDRWYDQ